MKEIIKNSKSLRDVSIQYFGYVNVITYSKIREYINQNNIDITHFIKNVSAFNHTKYSKIIKICPICGCEFETKSGHPKEKTVCSHSCANTFYRTGINHPNHKEDDDLMGELKYRTICFRYHEKNVFVAKKKILWKHIIMMVIKIIMLQKI